MRGTFSLSHHEELSGIIRLNAGLNAWVGSLNCHALDYREGDKVGNLQVGLSGLGLVVAENLVAIVLSRLDLQIHSADRHLISGEDSQLNSSGS